MRRKQWGIAALALGAGLCFAVCGWAAEGGHGEGGPPWGDFLKRLFNFAVMVGVLVYLLKKPLKGFFASRTESIRKSLSDLEGKKREAEERCAEYKAKLAALDKETERIVAEYIEEGETAKSKIIAQAEQQAEYIKHQARTAIDQEIRAAREALQQEVADLSTAAAEEVLKQHIGVEDQERLIQEFTTKVVEAK